MNIFFILENFYPKVGGVETLFYQLATSIVKAGHSCVVLTGAADGAPKEELVEGVRIIRTYTSNRYLFTLFSIPRAIQLAGKADIVHSTSYNAALSAFVASKMRCKKVIITFHEYWGRRWLGLPIMNLGIKILHRLFEYFIAHLPYDKVVCVSEITRNRLKAAGVSKEKLVRIYNGIDYSKFKSINRPSDINHRIPLITYFGRIGVSKGLDLLLSAIVECQKQRLNCQFLLIVPTIPKNAFHKIQDFMLDNNLDNMVEIRHELSFLALKDAISSSHCVVIPSYDEGFCYAAVETMALGVPIISSGRGALQEVLSGKYIEMSEYSTDSLVKAIQLAIRHKWDYKNQQKFPIKNTISAYLHLYESIL